MTWFSGPSKVSINDVFPKQSELVGKYLGLSAGVHFIDRQRNQALFVDPTN